MHPSTFDRKSALIFLCSIFLSLPLSELSAQDAFEEGLSHYQQRAAQADSFRANPGHINKALEAFERAMDENNKPQEAASYLLQAYYFKGMYVGLSEKDQKDIYNKGRSLGEQMIERFPKSVPIKFWYGANLGRWADVHGFVKSATSGIAGKLREACKQIIELDPKYQGGGGYRILAQVHFYSPNIPFLMGWPSDDRALELIEKAMAIAPEHPTNRMLYAQILLEFDRDEDAKKQLQYILEVEPRPTHLVEDRYVKHRSHQLLKEHF